MIFRTEGLAELTKRMCDNNKTCSGCPLQYEPAALCKFLSNAESLNETLSKVKHWNEINTPVTNLQKFREVFDYHFSELPDPRSSFWTDEFKGDTK